MIKAVAISSDHAGYELKTLLKAQLEAEGYIVNDLGANSAEDSVDYPDYGYKLASEVASGANEIGVAICGSGIGISIAANRNNKVRAALCHNEYTAQMARQHNDANILALGARVVDIDTASKCLQAFLNTPFEGGRHQRRVDKLSNNQE